MSIGLIETNQLAQQWSHWPKWWVSEYMQYSSVSPYDIWYGSYSEQQIADIYGLDINKFYGTVGPLRGRPICKSDFGFTVPYGSPEAYDCTGSGSESGAVVWSDGKTYVQINVDDLKYLVEPVKLNATKFLYSSEYGYFMEAQAMIGVFNFPADKTSFWESIAPLMIVAAPMLYGSILGSGSIMGGTGSIFGEAGSILGNVGSSITEAVTSVFAPSASEAVTGALLETATTQTAMLIEQNIGIGMTVEEATQVALAAMADTSFAPALVSPGFVTSLASTASQIPTLATSVTKIAGAAGAVAALAGGGQKKTPYLPTSNLPIRSTGLNFGNSNAILPLALLGIGAIYLMKGKKS